MRGLFAYLNRDQNTAKLSMSADLDLRNNCDFTEGTCAQLFDYRTNSESVAFEKTVKGPAILSPTSNLRLAYDPRLPAAAQMFRFQLGGIGTADKVTWVVNGETVAEQVGADMMWPVRRGTYAVQAIVQSEYGTEKLGPVAFSVR
jgi:membrane carboxypeptidase/penicillin-binding protein PbpC